jgi:hypothetical protein
MGMVVSPQHILTLRVLGPCQTYETEMEIRGGRDVKDE